jgi:hypothetical protein
VNGYVALGQFPLDLDLMQPRELTRLSQRQPFLFEQLNGE